MPRRNGEGGVTNPWFKSFEANLLMIIAELYTEATVADEVTGL